MGWTSRTGAIADLGAAAGPASAIGMRAGLVRVFAEEPLPPAVTFATRKVVVGRDATCDLALVDTAVSRQQAEITYAGGAWTLADPGSRNGTFVNGQRVERAVLKHGDLVRFGDVLFTFVRVDADGYAMHEARHHGELVGGYRIHRLVQALDRVAPSAIPIRLRGERGSEMDACARLLHQASARGGELRILRCGQRDVREIGAALFGAPRSEPQGGSRPDTSESPYRRAGDAPTPNGTVFFDDLDIAPNTVEWVGRTSARHPELRFIFGTPTWVEESPLWRYSITLLPLRDRKEDVLPICLDELERLGKQEVKVDVSFVAEVAARGLADGVEGLRRLVRLGAAALTGLRLTSEHLPPDAGARG